MRTLDEILEVMRNHMIPEEIVGAVGITSVELVDLLAEWCHAHYDLIESGLEAYGFGEAENEDDT